MMTKQLRVVVMVDDVTQMDHVAVYNEHEKQWDCVVGDVSIEVIAVPTPDDNECVLCHSTDGKIAKGGLVCNTCLASELMHLNSSELQSVTDDARDMLVDYLNSAKVV